MCAADMPGLMQRRSLIQLQLRPQLPRANLAGSHTLWAPAEGAEGLALVLGLGLCLGETVQESLYWTDLEPVSHVKKPR